MHFSQNLWQVSLLQNKQRSLFNFNLQNRQNPYDGSKSSQSSQDFIESFTVLGLLSWVYERQSEFLHFEPFSKGYPQDLHFSFKVKQDLQIISFPSHFRHLIEYSKQFIQNFSSFEEIFELQ
jgi:hypothetical protein